LATPAGLIIEVVNKNVRKFVHVFLYLVYVLLHTHHILTYWHFWEGV